MHQRLAAGAIGAVLMLLVAAGLGANAPLDLMNHPNGEHTFDVVNDDERSREILRWSLEIVGSVLSNRRP